MYAHVPASARGGLGLSVEETGRRLQLLHRIFSLYPDAPSAYNRWYALVSQLRLTGAQVHDTKIAALMLAHGLTHLLTYDVAHFRRYDGITLLSPHDFV